MGLERSYSRSEFITSSGVDVTDRDPDRISFTGYLQTSFLLPLSSLYLPIPLVSVLPEI